MTPDAIERAARESSALRERDAFASAALAQLRLAAIDAARVFPAAFSAADRARYDEALATLKRCAAPPDASAELLTRAAVFVANRQKWAALANLIGPDAAGRLAALCSERDAAEQSLVVLRRAQRLRGYMCLGGLALAALGLMVAVPIGIAHRVDVAMNGGYGATLVGLVLFSVFGRLWSSSYRIVKALAARARTAAEDEQLLRGRVAERDRFLASTAGQELTAIVRRHPELAAIDRSGGSTQSPHSDFDNMASRRAGPQASSTAGNALRGALPSGDPSCAGASPPPELTRADYDSVIDFLRSYAPGLGAGMETLMAVPKGGLFRSDDGDGTFFSKDDGFLFHEVRNKAMLGDLTSASDEYGLGVYGTSHSFYFVLVDMARRIIFQEKMFSLHDVEERTWQKTESSLGAALDKTETQRAEGMIAIHDGFTRTFRIR